MLIWRSGFDSRPGKISPFFIAFTSTLHNKQPTMQCVPRKVSPVKKHQEKTARPPLELHALSGTQRALPSVLHSVAFREGGQLFTDFVNGTKHIFARFEALTVILMKILPALASRISDNPRLTSRLYTGTYIPIIPTNFSSPHSWTPFSSHNFPSCSTTDSTDRKALQLPLAPLFSFSYPQITFIFSGASNFRWLQEPEVGGKTISPKFR